MKTTLAITKGLILGLAAVAVAIAVSSCGIPVKATLIGHYGSYSYSAKSGIELQIYGGK